MSVGAHFLIASAALLGYIGLGNYLYVGRVLPLLSDMGLHSGYSLHPVRRRTQIDAYLALIARIDHRPWWAAYLRHSRLVGFAVLALLLSVVLRMGMALSG
ncbi:MAG: hypothetical protein ACXIUZ_07065 [Lysobacteraceae bacterium]|jgi:hypothetical protein